MTQDEYAKLLLVGAHPEIVEAYHQYSRSLPKEHLMCKNIHEWLDYTDYIPSDWQNHEKERQKNKDEIKLLTNSITKHQT
jgi:hypothetical protein